MKVKLEHLVPFLLDKVKLNWFNQECELIGIDLEEELGRQLIVKFRVPNDRYQTMNVKIDDIKIESIEVYELVAASEIFSCPIHLIKGHLKKDNYISSIRYLLYLRLNDKGLNQSQIGHVMSKNRDTVSRGIMKAKTLLKNDEKFKKMYEKFEQY